MQNKFKLALIYGSTRPGRLCDKVAAWAASQASAHSQFALEVIDPAHPPAQQANVSSSENSMWLRERIGEADAFVVVTP